MGIHDDHRQRVYNRFLKEGLSSFEEHQALEFLLFLSRLRGDTNPLAHKLISQFGSLSEVLDAPVEELEKTPGVGHTTAVILKFIPQMCAYYLENKQNHKRIVFDSVEAVGNFFLPKFLSRTDEALYIATVDDRKQLLRCTLLSEGTENRVGVQMKNLVRETLQPGTTGVFLAHNHPHGVPLPSSADMELTRQICILLKMVDIPLLDHMIFSNGEFVSLAERKYLDMIEQDIQKSADRYPLFGKSM